jgi:TetR/AcrR family transcriptional regulator, repressor of the ameABC operon
MTAADMDALRRELVTLAMDMIARRCAVIGKTELAAEARIGRSRIDEVFPEEDDLFDAIVELWYEDDIATMEEVVASTLPTRRKFYEFFARRFVRERERYRRDPALFALYVEMGSQKFERIRGYIDLADHYLTELIAQAQAEGFFPDLTIDRALTLINQMVMCYTSPQMMLIIEERLAEDKLAVIVDTLFEGLSGADRGAKGLVGLRAAS